MHTEIQNYLYSLETVGEGDEAGDKRTVSMDD